MSESEVTEQPVKVRRVRKVPGYEKVPATDILQHMDEKVSRTIAELMVATGATEYYVKLWLRQLQTLGAVTCMRGVADPTGDGASGRRYWRYLKSGNADLSGTRPLSEDVVAKVYAAVAGQDLTQAAIAAKTKLPMILVTRSLALLVEKDDVAADMAGRYKACRVRNAPQAISPWDWRNYRDPHSPKDWDAAKPSTYKPLPKDIDL